MAHGAGPADEALRTAWGRFCEQLRDAGDKVFKDANPGAKVWLRRQAAEILADAILRKGKGFGSPFVAAAFIVHARHYLWPLAFRVLENKGYLPRWLESFPDPEGRRA